MNFNTPTTAALSRTWNTVTTYRECGVVVEVARAAVTLFRAFVGGPLLATVNGEACEVSRAVSLLQNADAQPEVTGEVLPTLPPTIGKTRAAKLHRIMGRIGLCNPDHYGNARRALGREVFSLATLTEAEARRVWVHLCRTFPTIRQAV